MSQPQDRKSLGSETDLHHPIPIDVEVRGRALVITPRREVDQHPRAVEWADHVIRSRPGPFDAIHVDLRHLHLASSGFVAGMLALLDHYRSENLTAITLWHARDRILRTLEMMNMRNSFLVRQSDDGGDPQS